MEVAVATHKADAGGAGRNAIEHQFNVRLLDMVAALDQTSVCQHVAEGNLAFMTILNALSFGCCCRTHLLFP